MKKLKEIVLFIFCFFGLVLFFITITSFIFWALDNSCTNGILQTVRFCLSFTFMAITSKVIIYGSFPIPLFSFFLTYLFYKKLKKTFYIFSILSIILILGFLFVFSLER